MLADIVPTGEYVSTLEEKYKGLEVPVYKLKKWFSESKRVFFDCESADKTLCLQKILIKPSFPAFRIYLVIRDLSTESYDFMDVNFRNLGGKENLEHFMNRYHQQLETMTKLSLQGAGREYMDCVGHGYEETMP